MLCAATHMAAQTDSVRLYTDTFKIAEQQTTIEMDDYLLDLVQQQSETIHANDTVDTLTLAELMRLDSIQRELAEVDSLRTVNAALQVQEVEKVPTIVIEKSWVKDEVEDRNDVLRAIRELRSPWRRELTLMVQVTQNYVTPNWYQGGSTSFAALGIAKGQVCYIRERFTWENFFEWRMGGSTVSADSLHKMNTTDDLFKIYSKANFRIVPKLFSSLSAELDTRLLPTYKSNSMDLKSAPFSPLRFNMAVGLDYKPVPGLSLSVSPISYKVIHVMDTARVTVTDYGLKEGQQTQHNFGSSLRLEYVWKPVREVALETKFYMYTNYQDVELDLEVNCDFIINRWLSARLTVHPRYDTSVIMEGDEHAKIQFRELLSIGFAHKFH